MTVHKTALLLDDGWSDRARAPGHQVHHRHHPRGVAEVIRVQGRAALRTAAPEGAGPWFRRTSLTPAPSSSCTAPRSQRAPRAPRGRPGGHLGLVDLEVVALVGSPSGPTCSTSGAQFPASRAVTRRSTGPWRSRCASRAPSPSPARCWWPPPPSRPGLVLLHQDDVFERIAAVTGQPVERVRPGERVIAGRDAPCHGTGPGGRGRCDRRGRSRRAPRSPWICAQRWEQVLFLGLGGACRGGPGAGAGETVWTSTPTDSGPRVAPAAADGPRAPARSARFPQLTNFPGSTCGPTSPPRGSRRDSS